MAKVIAPLMSSEARGRVGGLIYNTFRGLSTVKAACAPAQPRTSLQLKIRAYGVRLARTWQTLTAVQRASWTTYANNHPETDSMGSPKRISGLNYYMRLNSRLLQLNLTIQATAPTIPGPNPVVGFTSAGGAGSISFGFATTGGLTNIWVHADGPHSPGRLGQFAKARFALATSMATAPSVLSGMPPGNYDLFARAVYASNGLSSPWVLSTAVVT